MSDLIFGPGAPFVEQLRRAAGRFPGGRVQVAVAWATDEGAAMFLDAVRGLSQVEVLVGVNAQGTTVEALLRLLGAAGYLGVHYRHPLLTYHPKVYVFDEGDDEGDTGLIAVGSSNMTLGGLHGNVETSLLLGPDGSELGGALRSWRAQWNDLVGSPFTTCVTDPEVVEGLHRAGHVPTERERQSRRGNEAAGWGERGDGGKAGGGARAGALLELPTEQPRQPPAFDRSPVSIPFAVEDEAEEEAQEDHIETQPDHATAQPDHTAAEPHAPSAGSVGDEAMGDVAAATAEDLLFVRTFTANDVAKLVRNDDGEYQSGTFEPDIGLAVRDLHPGFWGWPERFAAVRHKLVREEWPASARLFSSAEPTGVDIEVVLWFREARPGHAAEFRLRPGPIPVVRDATPAGFGTDGLLAVRRMPAGSPHDFALKLIARGEPDWPEYEACLSDRKPAHRYGYARLRRARSAGSRF
jgi:hypothetical protein